MFKRDLNDLGGGPLKYSYRINGFEIWPTRRVVLCAGQPVAIGARAFDVLLTLVQNRPRLVTKRELLDAVWPGLVVEEANVQVQVSMLRKVLGPNSITTVPGLGYRFVATVDSDADEPPQEVLSHAAQRQSGDNVVAVQPRRLSNIPEVADSLVGREADLAAVSSLVACERLVEILGPGGVGKTRLAQDVARSKCGDFLDGVWWVDLAAIANPGHIVIAIANAANVDVSGGKNDEIDRLVNRLEARHMLLVLDNCEHLIANIRVLVQEFLARAGRLFILVTSQEALGIGSGIAYRLAPLACPQDGSDFEQARSSSALEFLERRAKAVDRRFALTSENIEAATKLVRRLDGNPLAIGMAAARAPSLGLGLLNHRLNERFELLRSVGHVAHARHQTLLATLEWSDSLLANIERTVLRCLSTFVGSFRVESALAATMKMREDEWSVLEAISALVDKSLMQVESLEPPRYRLLETVRTFCTGQLEQYGEAAEAALHHGHAMRTVATEIEERYWEMSDSTFLAQYAQDYDDLQAAFDRARVRGDVECAAITGCALMRLDHLRGFNAPHRARAEALYGLLPKADAMSAAWIWTSIAAHGLIELEFVTRLEAAASAVLAWRGQGNAMRLHYALGFHASASARARDFETADHLVQEASMLERPDWPLRRLMWSASARSGVCIHKGDALGYRQASRQELQLAERAGADRVAAWARLKLADAALMANDFPEAIELGQSAVATLRTLDQPSNLGLAMSNLCAAYLLSNNCDSAVSMAIEAMPLMLRNGWGYLLLDSVALIAATDQDFTAAIEILGFVDAWYARHGSSRQSNEASLRKRTSELMGLAPPDVLIPSGLMNTLLTEGQVEATAYSTLERSASIRRAQPDASTNPY